MESEKKDNTEKNHKFESEAFKVFKALFNNEKETEEKIAKALEFMRALLSDFEKGVFKMFWDVKKLVAPLFKEKMNPIKRNHLWSEYAELGDEARRLKEIKDEEAAFAIEQLELAIEALETDISHYDHLLRQVNFLDFPEGLRKLSLDEDGYQAIEKELHLLKTLVARLDALRKEILSIDMRISHKNKILKRLSTLGDAVFPKRKEFIKKVSDSFIADVTSFVHNRFPEGDDNFGAPYYVIRDEIKSFQRLAKLLTLNTQSFNKTRKVLNECWDKIKEKEKERRVELNERSEEEKNNFKAFLPKVEAFEAFCLQEENQEKSQVLEQSNILQNEMKNTVLSWEHVKILKDRMQQARSVALDKVEATIEKKKHTAKKEIDDLKEKLAELIKHANSNSLENLETCKLELTKHYERLNLSTIENHLFEREFAGLQSCILNKKANMMSAEQLEELYSYRSAHVELIKKQMEEYRKAMGGSNLDFEKAMAYRELYDSAKIHLNNEMEELETLEEKLI